MLVYLVVTSRLFFIMIMDSLLNMAKANPFLNPFSVVECAKQPSIVDSKDQRLFPVPGRNIMAAATGKDVLRDL